MDFAGNYLKRWGGTLGLTGLLTFMAPVAYGADLSTQAIFGIDFDEDWFTGTDRYYTTGTRYTLTWIDASSTTFPGKVGALLAHLLPAPQEVNRDPVTTLGIATQYYTPTKPSASGLDPGERPYAGWLYVDAIRRDARVDETGNTLSEDLIEVQLGIVGPHTYSADLQTWFHKHIFGSPVFVGWPNQIHDEIGGLGHVERRKRMLLSEIDGFGVDLWPEISGIVGNVRIHAETGITMRFGYHVPSRLGVGIIGPSLFSLSPDWSFYGTAGAATRLVFRNIFLDGNTFQDSARVDRRWWVTDAFLGAFVQHGAFSLGYEWITRSKEFFGQESPQQYGALSLSFTTSF